MSEDTVTASLNKENRDVIHQYYSHLTSLFVSAYTGFFALLGAFLALFGTVILGKESLGKESLGADRVFLIVLGSVICFLAFLSYVRARRFGDALNHIETHHLVLKTGVRADDKSVKDWSGEISPLRGCLAKIAQRLSDEFGKLVPYLLLMFYALFVAWLIA